MESTKTLWVFGYGSLCWHPGFQFNSQQPGFIRGFSRKFFQGNNSHRGTVDKPGRVVTLIEEDEGTTWGMAFELAGEEALDYLNRRECTLGGYRTMITMFYPRNGSMSPFPALLYIATPDNCQWLGPAPLHEMATQVADCSGEAGHNAEYVIRLADFVRDTFPEVYDEHLFTLESLVRLRLKEKNINASQILSRKDANVSVPVAEGAAAAGAHPADPNAAEAGDNVRRDSFQYQSRVAPKKLLCLKV